jgi:hypothetical protein
VKPRRSLLWFALVCGLAELGQSPARAQDPLFPFVLPWSDASPSIANVSGWLEKPAGASGPLTGRQGHLWAGSKRIRLFGVNVCFGANFPTHAEAEQVAGRMAKFGINCVRFHHMDMFPAPGGIFAKAGTGLDSGQVDRLDYFIAQLKAHGIYVDLNLHVSRTYPELPTWPLMPSFHKGVDQFDGRMIDWQRRYARELLTHQNPYTKARYVNEPAVALVEINNENALLHEWWSGELDGMPAVYADPLAKAWNGWLAGRYADFTALKRAWNVKDRPLGPEMLTNGGFSAGTSGWSLEQHEGAQASTSTADTGPAGGRGVKIAVERAGKAGWHVQLSHAGLAFAADAPYTLRFRAKADKARTISVTAMQAHPPWNALWQAQVPLATDWQTFQFVLAPGEAELNGRITFTNLAEQAGSIWLAEVGLKPGGVLGLRAGETAGRLGIFRKGDYSSRTAPAQRDWIRFLWETEDRYWTEMYRFLKDDLKVHSLVVGTQMGWSPFPIQAKLDVIDSHAYWQHPHFPGRAWDMDNWSVQNTPMAGAPDGGTLPRLALARVAGKPFICTEYNHPAPNSYSSEAFLLLAAFAAMQDWDGIFAFDYCSRGGEWDARKISGFFDVDQHPAKMVTLPAAVAMFVRGDLASPVARLHATAPLEAVLERVRQAGPYLGADAFGIDRLASLRAPVELALDGVPAVRETPQSSAAPAWVWGAMGKRLVTVDTPRSKALIGSIDPADHHALGDVRIDHVSSRQGWAALTLTAIDGSDFRSPGRLLVTATGDAENTGMRWKNAEKNSVGSDWGRAPSLVEGITARIVLPVPARGLKAWALDERGQRKHVMPVGEAEGKAVLELGPKYHTLWYEVEVDRLPQG